MENDFCKWAYDYIDKAIATRPNQEKYKAALEAVKKHIEITLPSGYEMSATWNIVNEALKKDEAIE